MDKVWDKKQEPIGKLDDLKLFPFEKHYILLSLKEYLDNIEKIATDLENVVRKDKKMKKMDIAAASTVRGVLVRDLKVVIERVEATKTIK